jgi:hypothetical protein
MRIESVGTERPSSWAPYSLGTSLSSISSVMLGLSAVADWQTEPQESVSTVVWGLGAFVAVGAFGYLSAIPRKVRHRKMNSMFPGDVVLEAIVQRRLREALRLDDELRRAYTVSLVFSSNTVTMWKRGSKPTRVWELPYREIISMQIGVVASPNGTVASFGLGATDGLLQFPLIVADQRFNVPTGYQQIVALTSGLEGRVEPR